MVLIHVIKSTRITITIIIRNYVFYIFSCSSILTLVLLHKHKLGIRKNMILVNWKKTLNKKRVFGIWRIITQPSRLFKFKPSK